MNDQLQRKIQVLFDHVDPNTYGGNNYYFLDIEDSSKYRVSVGWALIKDHETFVFKYPDGPLTKYSEDRFVFPKEAFGRLGIEIYEMHEATCIESGLPTRVCFHCGTPFLKDLPLDDAK